MTYEQLIESWTDERLSLGEVEEYTAKKDRQKALRLVGLSQLDADKITKADIRKSEIETLKEVSNTTVNYAMKNGKRAYNWAIEYDMLDRNPFIGVKKPRLNKTDRKPMQSDRAQIFAQKMHDGSETWMRIAYVALMTGMRRGELLALSPDCVHDSTIDVTRSMKCDHRIGEPKTQTSIRTIAVTKDVKDMCLNGASEKFCFPGENGEMFSPNILGHSFRRWCDSNGFEGLRFHELRHTHATLLIAQGMDIKTVQHRLGHSSATITMDVYAHAIPSKDVEAANMMEVIMNG